MAKYDSAEDVYKELVDDSDESWLYGLVTFAVIEEQRIEWMRHQLENTGSEPNIDEVTAWYQQLTQMAILRAKETAENELQNFSEEVYDSALAEHKEEIRNGIVVSEIRQSSSFRSQFVVNVAGGFVGALLFAAFVGITAFIALADASPAEIGAELRDMVEEINNG